MKYIFGIFALGFIGVIVAAALKSPYYMVRRSVTINAPVERPFGLINDFHMWPEWSPWEKIDKNMKRTFEGAPYGKGSIYSWEGNEEVGSGRMTMTENNPGMAIHIILEFFKPWEATNHVKFLFEPLGPHTNVTWTMSGETPFLGRIFTLFFNMDKMVGTDFEKGLAQLKAKSESP